MTVTTFTTRVLENTHWMAMRSESLMRVSRASLAALAGLAAVGRPIPAAAATCCTGPNGAGSCAMNNCDSYICQGQCGFVNGFCTDPSNPCWSSVGCPGQTCCDCSCFDGTHSFYCYCVGL